MCFAASPGGDFQCSVGFFQCGDLAECVEQRLWCDGTEHCSNTQDEHPQHCSQYIATQILVVFMCVVFYDTSQFSMQSK